VEQDNTIKNEDNKAKRSFLFMPPLYTIYKKRIHERTRSADTRRVRAEAQRHGEELGQLHRFLVELL